MRCIYCLKNNAEYVVAGNSVCGECLKKKGNPIKYDKYKVTLENCNEKV